MVSMRIPGVTSWRALVVLALWLASVAGAAVVGAYAYRSRAAIRSMLSSVQGGPMIETTFYNLSVQKLSVPGEGRDGGISVLGEGILFVNRLGNSWYVGPDLSLQPLSLRVPVNVDAFEADPYNVHTVTRELFAVKDVLVQPRREGIRILASYNHWYQDEDCYVLRVSALEASVEEVMAHADLQDRWTTVYETAPCRELTENPNGINRNPTLAAGGRMAVVSDHEILVTVGAFGPETIASDAQGERQLTDTDHPYGKTIFVNLDTGDSRIYSIGHRNPQGLAASSSGEIWLTEHAARGGDELNRIVEGKDYGFPSVSYGTEYESMVWSPNPRQGHHDGFEKPMYVWLPSIGISQVTLIEGTMFEHWRGDILVSSLSERSLFRVRVEDGRAIFAEPIFVEHRIRDIVEAADGAIVLKTDDDFLVFLRRIDAESMDLASLDAPTRGRLLATNCSGCHEFERDGTEAIGPTLWGIVGRDVAASDGYAYSEALRGLEGEWSIQLLSRFLTDPNGVAPGTSMVMTRSYSDSEIAAIVAYLETLR